MPRLVALLLAAAATTASAESDENNFTAASADVTHYQRSLAARGAGDVRRGLALPGPAVCHGPFHTTESQRPWEKSLKPALQIRLAACKTLAS